MVILLEYSPVKVICLILMRILIERFNILVCVSEYFKQKAMSYTYMTYKKRLERQHIFQRQYVYNGIDYVSGRKFGIIIYSNKKNNDVKS